MRRRNSRLKMRASIGLGADNTFLDLQTCCKRPDMPLVIYISSLGVLAGLINGGSQ